MRRALQVKPGVTPTRGQRCGCQNEMKKSILLNGLLVGEYEATGDPEQDIVLMNEFLKAKGLYRERTTAQATFMQALAFCRTAATIYERDLTGPNRHGPSAAPFVVNAAFSIELYLKTLHELAGKGVRGHDLLKLLDALSAEHQGSVLRCAQKHAPSYQVPVPSADSFRSIVASLATAFVDWRYWHESGHTGLVDIQPTILLLKALDEACREHGAA